MKHPVYINIEVTNREYLQQWFLGVGSIFINNEVMKKLDLSRTPCI